MSTTTKRMVMKTNNDNNNNNNMMMIIILLTSLSLPCTGEMTDGRHEKQYNNCDNNNA